MTRRDGGARRRRTRPLRPRALKRIFLLFVVIALVVSYIGPIRGYRAKRAELRGQEVALQRLIVERDSLRHALRQIKNPAVMESRARELGFMKEGEVQYRVTGLEQPADSGLWGIVAR